jgi:hypothetical protein
VVRLCVERWLSLLVPWARKRQLHLLVQRLLLRLVGSCCSFFDCTAAVLGGDMNFLAVGGNRQQVPLPGSEGCGWERWRPATRRRRRRRRWRRRRRRRRDPGTKVGELLSLAALQADGVGGDG